MTLIIISMGIQYSSGSHLLNSLLEAIFDGFSWIILTIFIARPSLAMTFHLYPVTLHPYPRCNAVTFFIISDYHVLENITMPVYSHAKCLSLSVSSSRFDLPPLFSQFSCLYDMNAYFFDGHCLPETICPGNTFFTSALWSFDFFLRPNKKAGDGIKIKKSELTQLLVHLPTKCLRRLFSQFQIYLIWINCRLLFVFLRYYKDSSYSLCNTSFSRQ
jgi:hypothetical protein